MPRRQRVRWHHRPWVSATLAWLIAGYLYLIDRTGRWQLDCTPATEDLIRAGKPFIGAFWHGRLLMGFAAWRRLLRKVGIDQHAELYIISSVHADGQLIQSAAHRMGAKTLWGSSRRGGAKVLREAQKVLEDGNILVITPDGPRGPRMRSQPGIAYLARSTNVPVVPITFAAGRQRTLNSWDRFILVLPFARGTVAFGDPIDLPEEGDTESHRVLIEKRLIALSNEVDRAQGLDPVQPAS